MRAKSRVDELKAHIVLVEPEYYTRYPPIGLLKISSYEKSKGNTTELVRKSAFPKKKPDKIYVTSLFTWAWKPVWNTVRVYKAWFPDVEIYLGGLYASLLPDHAKLSGADKIFQGIFWKSEEMMPDYSLVPDWDGSIVWASRGCNNKCIFCVVPKLEGSIKCERDTIKNFVLNEHTKIIFFDNNILAIKYWKNIFRELIEIGKNIDFNQGLDARLLNDESADLLSQMKIPIIRFAYDIPTQKPFVKKAVNILIEKGISKRHILVYSLFNYKESPDECFERVRDILEWGAVCYPMRFQPCYTLMKNSYVSPKWTKKELQMMQQSRRVIGFGGAFPPYKALVKKFEKAKNFEEAFSLYSINKKIRGQTNLDIFSIAG